MIVKALGSTKNNAGIRDGEMLALAMRKKYGNSNGFGFAIFGSTEFGDSLPLRGIYQGRLTGYNQMGRSPWRPRKRYFVVMRDYAPTNPRTVEQQARREAFADGASEWAGLTTEEKAEYNMRAKGRALSGYNLFMSEYLIAN